MTTGVAPTNFTNRYTTTNQTWTVESVSEAEDSRVFRFVHTASAIRLFSFDDVDADSERQDAEIVVRWRINDADAHLGFSLWLNGSGAAGTEDGYLVEYELQFGVNEQFQLKRYDAGTPTDIGSTVVFSGNRPVIDAWYYARFRKNGTALQFRVWNEGSAEPTDWLIDQTDSDLDVDGWVGVGVRNQDQFEIDYVGVGTNGDTAPIDASTNTIARVTHMGAKVVQQNDAGQIRLTQLAAKVIGQNDTGDIRLTHMGLKVLHAGPIVVDADHAIPVESLQGIVSSATDGDGSTIDSPIYIFDAADLIAIDLTKHYALANDIDVSAENWTPLGAATTNFTGSLDGHGFKVFGLNSTYVADAFGLFWRMGGTGIIRNLGVATTVGGITGQSSSIYSGVLVGIGNNSYGWLIEDCWVEGKIDTGGDRCGGLIGITNSSGGGPPDNTLRRNRVAVWLSGTIGTRVGGVTGFSDGTGLTHSDNYFDSDVATTTSDGQGSVGTAKTTVLMQEEATFNNFDFDDVWFIREAVDYPYLRENQAIRRTPIEWLEPNPPTRISTLTTEVLRQGDPLARVSTEIVEVLRQGDPLGRVSTLVVEVLRTISAATPVDSDHAIPIEWRQGLALDHAIPTEWLQGIAADHQIPINWEGEFSSDHEIPVEWSLNLNVDGEIPVEWSAVITPGDFVIPIEWGEGVATDAQMPIEWFGWLAADSVILINWSGAFADPGSDYVINVEWHLEMLLDDEVPVEWNVGLVTDHLVPVEWLLENVLITLHEMPIEWVSLVDFDKTIPITWHAELLGDREIPIEWQLVIELDIDRQMPVEWGALLRPNYAIPIEWFQVLELDHSIPVSWHAELEIDRTIPVEWLQIIVLDRTIPISWSGVVDELHGMPVEWLANPDEFQQMPIDWAGATLSFDHIMPIEWRSGVVQDHVMPFEWLLETIVAFSKIIPIEWRNTLPLHQADSIMQIEWTTRELEGPWTSSRFRPILIEWQVDPGSFHHMPVDWINPTFALFVTSDLCDRWAADCQLTGWDAASETATWVAEAPGVEAQSASPGVNWNAPDEEIGGVWCADKQDASWIASEQPTSWQAADCPLVWDAEQCPTFWRTKSQATGWIATPQGTRWEVFEPNPRDFVC